EDVAAVIMIDPDYHPNAVPWMHWRNPSAPHIRLWRQLLRPFWLARLWLRRLPMRLKGEIFPEPAALTGSQRERGKALFAGMKAALKAFRPGPYDGPVFIISSAERRRLLAKPGTGWPSLAPKVQFIEVSASHDEFFIGALAEVGEAMERILASIQAAPAARPGQKAAE